MSSTLVCGIDLGGTHTQVGVVDTDGNIVGREGAKTQASLGVDAVLDNIAEAVRAAANQAGITADQLASIGFAAPGGCDPVRGIVYETGNLGWPHNFPLGDEMAKRLPGPPIVVDNDVNAAAFGEFRYGAAKDDPDLLAVWVGTGIGGGLVIDGRLHHGSLGTAGEIGQTLLLPSSPTGERLTEHACSRLAVVSRIALLIRRGRPSMVADLLREQEGDDADPRRIDAAMVARAYHAGDELAVTVINESADLLGTAIANTLTVLAIGAVVLGGGLSEQCGHPYVERIAAATRAHFFPSAVGERIRFALTELRENAGLLGAAAIARDRAGA
ncbi:MAG: ROK family protein [Planctomycetota bacterium]